ncbi:kinase-like domain-containing protein [Mycena crocata]|nr:kinase-like domain-containing protein [Mycena crocata]
MAARREVHISLLLFVVAVLTGSADQIVDHVDTCIQNPPHPRNTGPYIPPAHPSLTANADLKRRAESVLDSLANAYSRAVENATHTDAVAKPKLRGSAALRKAVPRLLVKLSKAHNKNERPSKSNAELNPTLEEFLETTSYSEVHQSLAAVLDRHYLAKYGFRITSDLVTFKYTGSGTVIKDAHTLGSIGDLFRASPGITISVKDRKNRVLDLQAIVDYPPREDPIHVDSDSDFEIPTTRTGGKRKAASHSLKIQPAKCPSLAIAGAAAYTTSVEVNEVQYSVSRTDCHIEMDTAGDGGELYLDGNKYAAKEFYNIGAGNRLPSPEENLKNLRNELTVQKMAALTVTRFQDHASERRVPIADLRVADAFILSVTHGPEKHRSWLVDPLLSHCKTEKFSGTNVAGNHVGDLFGATCDALAHYSLQDSSETLVYVDIQGIKEPQLVNGVRGADVLVLFVLMVHTKGDSNALGDQGPDGIAKFKSQHKCNSICKRLSLTRIPQAAMDEQGLKELNTNLEQQVEGGDASDDV